MTREEIKELVTTKNIRNGDEGRSNFILYLTPLTPLSMYFQTLHKSIFYFQQFCF
jgi:hypothetical protein